MTSPKLKEPVRKFRKITGRSVEDDYEHNVWRSVEDMWVEMYCRGIDVSKIKDIIMFQVDGYIQFLESEAKKDLHHMSAQKRRKLR